MAIELDTFKAGMRCLAGHVCLVTTMRGDGERSGLTATAVCSVSAVPPTLLCCVNRENSTHAAVRNAGFFAVNVLGSEDRQLADRFATSPGGEARFVAGLWSKNETGAPLLDSALASFDCRIAQAVDVGTHGILFGDIVSIRVRLSEAKPLLYAHGQYGGFTSFDEIRSVDSLWIPSWGGVDPNLR